MPKAHGERALRALYHAIHKKKRTAKTAKATVLRFWVSDMPISPVAVKTQYYGQGLLKTIAVPVSLRCILYSNDLKRCQLQRFHIWHRLRRRIRADGEMNICIKIAYDGGYRLFAGCPEKAARIVCTAAACWACTHFKRSEKRNRFPPVDPNEISHIGEKGVLYGAGCAVCACQQRRAFT